VIAPALRWVTAGFAYGHTQLRTFQDWGIGTVETGRMFGTLPCSHTRRSDVMTNNAFLAIIALAIMSSGSIDDQTRRVLDGLQV
jgi:hypothetical protein